MASARHCLASIVCLAILCILPLPTHAQDFDYFYFVQQVEDSVVCTEDTVVFPLETRPFDVLLLLFVVVVLVARIILQQGEAWQLLLSDHWQTGGGFLHPWPLAAERRWLVSIELRRRRVRRISGMCLCVYKYKMHLVVVVLLLL
jgi:hypothetical protein